MVTQRELSNRIANKIRKSKMEKEIPTIYGGGCPEYNEKMEKEFVLSEKMYDYPQDCFKLKDIKEFIKRLKELGKHRLENKQDYEMYCEDIDKLAGDKLTK